METMRPTSVKRFQVRWVDEFKKTAGFNWYNIEQDVN